MRPVPLFYLTAITISILFISSFCAFAEKTDSTKQNIQESIKQDIQFGILSAREHESGTNYEPWNAFQYQINKTQNKYGNFDILINDGYEVSLGRNGRYSLTDPDGSNFVIEVSLTKKGEYADTINFVPSQIVLRDSLGNVYKAIGCAPEQGKYPISSGLIDSTKGGYIKIEGKSRPLITFIASAHTTN